MMEAKKNDMWVLETSFGMDEVGISPLDEKGKGTRRHSSPHCSSLTILSLNRSVPATYVSKGTWQMWSAKKLASSLSNSYSEICFYILFIYLGEHECEGQKINSFHYAGPREWNSGHWVGQISLTSKFIFRKKALRASLIDVAWDLSSALWQVGGLLDSGTWNTSQTDTLGLNLGSVAHWLCDYWHQVSVSVSIK